MSSENTALTRHERTMCFSKECEKLSEVQRKLWIHGRVKCTNNMQMQVEFFSGMAEFLYFRLMQFINMTFAVKSIFQPSVAFTDISS